MFPWYICNSLSGRKQKRFGAFWPWNMASCGGWCYLFSAIRSESGSRLGDGGMYIFFGISPSKKTTGINTVSVFVFCFLYTATLFSGPGPNVSCHILVHSKWSKRGFAEGPRDANNHGASAVNSNANILRPNPFVWNGRHVERHKLIGDRLGLLMSKIFCIQMVHSFGYEYFR